MYQEQGRRFVPTTRVVMLRTEMRLRIALAVTSLSISIVSAVTCVTGETNLAMSIFMVLLAFGFATQSGLTHHLGVSTQTDVFVQKASSSVILFVDINLHLLSIQLTSC